MRKRASGKASTAREKVVPARSRKSAEREATLLSPAGDSAPRGKTRLTMYLDVKVVEYFRSLAGGRGYQTLINDALRRAIERENLENVLRRVIREEARPAQSVKAKS
jgi:uncharacterized protein (DUF4415 family)